MTGMPRLKFSVLPQVWSMLAQPRDCSDGSEPCPWPRCRHRIDNPAHPEVTCAIDVAEEEEVMAQTQVAKVLGISQQRVDYLEQSGKRKILRHEDGPMLLATMRGL